MSKNYYIGLKKNSFLGVTNQNVQFVIQIKISKPQVQFVPMNMSAVFNHITQKYINVMVVKESKFDFLDIIHPLNYFKQKQVVVENGLIYSELYYTHAVLKHVLFLIMKIMYGMNFIMRRKKDGYMLTLVKKRMIHLQFMNKDWEEL